METLQRTANRGSISTGYDIDNSLKFEADNSERIRRNQTTGTNRKKFTVSFWVKRTEIGAFQVLAIAEGSGNDISFLDFESDDFLRFRDTVSGSNQCILETNRVFRDSSAWYHIVLRVDTTLSTADDRARIYVNGVQETSFSTRTNFDQNDDTFWGYNGGNLTWGNALAEANYFSGYVAEAVYVDGQSLAPTEFGEFDSDSGIWIPKDVSGLTFGNNGYYLDFKDASNLGNDASGGTDFSLINITSADQATDTPTNNFCTWSPLWTYEYTGTLTEGATNRSGSTGQWQGAKGTIGVTNGKWYWENKASGNDTIIGWQTDEGVALTGNSHNILSTIGLYQDGNYIWIKDSTSGRNDTSASGSNVSGQIIGFALDLDSSPQTATFYRNGSAIASNVNIDGLTGKTIFPFVSQYNQSSESNFGGYTTISISSAASDENGYGTFEYAPPSGYYALCTKNLAEYG